MPKGIRAQPGDHWRPIEGYEGTYEVAYNGKVRRLWMRADPSELTPYVKKTMHKSANRKTLYVGLVLDGKKKVFAVHHLVAKAWLPPKKKEECIYHINGIHTDNWAINLAYALPKDLGKLTAQKAGGRIVAKLDETGETVAVYTSARKAAKAGFMSYQTVIDRCNGKNVGPFAPDGYAYAWECSVISMNQAFGKIKAWREKSGLPEVVMERVDRDYDEYGDDNDNKMV